MAKTAADTEMPFLDHLEELRQRLFWIAGAIVVGVVLSFIVLSQKRLDIVGLLAQPIKPYLRGQSLVYTHPGTSFKIILNASVLTGLLLATPVIGYQLWGFFAPALHPHEKRIVVPVLFGMLGLFVAGVALCFFVVLPFTLRFFHGFESATLTPMIEATQYFGFAFSMMIAFGVAFELPIGILLLSALGIVSPSFLAKYRRHAIVICVVAAAFITPDASPTTLFALAGPLYFLFELGVALSFMVTRSRRKRAREAELEEQREREARIQTPMVSRGEPRRLGALVILLAMTAFSSIAGAQIVRPSVRGPVVRADTARNDSTADSSKVKEIIKWIEPDSVTTELLNRTGYSVTKYQGVRVTFNAKKHTLFLEGDPAGVARGVTLLIGDTILYNDSTKLVLARGDTLILRDPTQGAADLVALGEMRYNVEARRGSVTNISTALESGERWYVGGSRAGFISDTTRGSQTAFYVRNGSITSCDDSIPDYHFQSKEIKLISKNLMVARPAVLYIGDVPVMWLPFIFQDMRSGRRSGILTPRFGLSELFRNSPTYRRHLENLGYYFAFSDYMDFQTTLDWRSGSNSREGDPGWVRLNGEWRYRWLDRFLTGRLAVSHLAQRDGTSNTAYSWGHQQDFSESSHLTMDINYVTNTTIQRQNSFDPRQVLSTIQSQVSYRQKLGKADFSIGGSRRQYPGRQEVTQDFPNFSITTPTISAGKWLDWTPSLDVRNSEQLKVDQVGEFAYRFFDRNGVRDSTRLRADSRISNLSFTTPIKIFGFLLSNSIRVTDRENNAPVRLAIIDQNDPTHTTDRVFARTFSTEVDWQSAFSLPPFLASTFKVSPYVSMSNVDPHAYYVRTEQTGGRYVHQSKRFSYGASASPTLFGLFPGIGKVERFRHTINPVITWSFSPAATVGREYLAALNTNPATYIGSLPQHQVSLGLSQAIEAKLRTRDTTATEGKKVKVLGINFTSLTYDFERKKAGHPGLINDQFGYDLSSDLLPGFRLGVQYSLFEGSVISDTAIFKPFRTGIDASFSVNGQSGIFAAISRIFGKAVPQPTPQIERLQATNEDALAQRAANTPVAGSAVSNRLYSMPSTQGWQASFTFSSSRQRVTRGGTVIEIDPAAVCRQVGLGLAYDLCIEQQRANPTSVVPIQGITAGAPIIRQPPHENVQSQMSFHVTPKWSASWNTNYDFRAREFGSHAVTLQRELHDWRTVFAFTRSPNGNFAFSFFIALNAQPDIKFDYDRQTYNQAGR